LNDKIRPEHQQRTAYVYWRQSIDEQWQKHGDGNNRQCALADRVLQLGFQRVVVIDQDVGRPCGEPDDRPGFSQVLSEISRGNTGAVLALEATRLVRNGEEWGRFIDLCAATGTLYIDANSVYDPRLASDRRALGVGRTKARYESP